MSIFCYLLAIGLCNGQHCTTPLYNTPAINSPVFNVNVESVSLGQLPQQWSHSGDGTAQAVNSNNHTPGGSKSVRITAAPGTTSVLAISSFGPGLTGNLFAMSAPGMFGKQGTLTVKYYGNVGGSPNTLLLTASVDLASGNALNDYGDGFPCNSVLSQQQIESYQVIDFDVSPDGPPGTRLCRECVHTSSQTIWYTRLTPLSGVQGLDKLEVHLQSTGSDQLDVYVDDFAVFNAQIITATVAIPLNIETGSNAAILSWTNSAFTLQAAPFVTGLYTNIPGATSPYTNPVTGTQQYFRLIAN